MIISCALPFRAVALGWQPRRGHAGLTVVCKATYKLTQSLSPLSQPTEIVRADVMRPDGATVQVPSDIAPFKAQPEVVLLAQARPRGARVAAAGIDHAAVDWGSVSRCDAPPCCLVLDTWRSDAVLQLPALDGADPSRFNVTPAHQRVRAFPEEIDISLHGMHPTLTTRLAPVAPRVFLSLNDAEKKGASRPLRHARHPCR